VPSSVLLCSLLARMKARLRSRPLCMMTVIWEKDASTGSAGEARTKNKAQVNRMLKTAHHGRAGRAMAGVHPTVKCASHACSHAWALPAAPEAATSRASCRMTSQSCCCVSVVDDGSHLLCASASAASTRGTAASTQWMAWFHAEVKPVGHSFQHSSCKAGA
jgi:hypothetical protein